MYIVEPINSQQIIIPFYFQSTVRKYVKDGYDSLMSKSEEFKQDLSSKTILQQYILNMEKHKLTFNDIIALTSDFLVAGIDTVRNFILFYM